MKEDGLTARSLPTSTPDAQGVDAGAIEAFLDLLEGVSGIEPHSLMVLRHGYVIAAGWWAPYAADQPHALYSLSKTFTATAAGLAVGEGLVRLDEPVVSYFPEFADEISDSRARAVLVRHVAAMASGHQSGRSSTRPDRTSGSPGCTRPRTPLRGWASSTCSRARGTGSSCCPRNGWPRRRLCRSRRTGWTAASIGSRGTATRSGHLATDIAATGRPGSSASCCPTRPL